MATISKERILALRKETGAPLLDCRRALEAAHGDLERARERLRKRGADAAAAKAERATGEGTIGVYVHGEGRIAALVLLRCETDFVAKSDAFRQLAKDLAMQVVSMNPAVVEPQEGKPDMRPEEVALLAQPFVKDPSGHQTVRDLLAAKVLEFGENVRIETFARFAV